ncbi:MAG: PilC/PilY family type IV pilus protein [Pseudomonadota bacterium]
MSKFSIKLHQWIGLLTFLAASVAVFRLAFAITAFTPGSQPVGYVAQDEVSNFNLTSGQETVYRTEYEREFWSGNLYAYPVDATGTVDIAAERWTGGAKANIDQQNFDTGRLIATMRDDGTKVPFRAANLSAVQQAALAATINTTAYTSTQIVNFLRGDRSNEGPMGMRIRGSALGDIVHTRPYYVSDASNPTVFVGANDGMLHAINTTDGSERWAYVPSMLLGKMINLAKPYGGVSNPHDYFVDGQINVATLTSSGSKRVLVGALGAGGRGLYALDINGSSGLTATSEADVSGGVANKILWEITPTKVNYANPVTANAYVNLGYTYGTPIIAKVSGVDAVIIGNGYNDGLGNYSGCTHATPNYANCGGDYQAYLYIINAYTGQLISKIKAGTSGTSASPNGLSSPVAVDSDGNGSVDYVYAGDLNGTLWKFTLATSIATPLLTTSPAQPITSPPGVALHPNGGYMINFGTGSMFTDASTDTTTYYVYGIWDGAPVANTTMVTQTLTERSYTYAGVTTRVRRSTAIAPNWSNGGDKGWRVALPAGERVVGDGSFIENDRFYFTSHNPTVSTTIPATNTVVWGENWLMELDYLSGGSRNEPFLDMDENLLLNNGDRIKYTATDTLPAGKVVGDYIDGTDGIPVGKWLSIGVQSQPILVQLQTLNTTLFNQNPDVVFPVTEVQFGVTGGHFDEDIYYGTGAAANAVGSVTFTYASSNTAKNVTALTIVANGETLYSGAPGNMKPKDLDDFLNGKSSANYTITKNYNDDHTIKIAAKTPGSALNGTITVTITTTGTTPGYTKVDLTGGTDAGGGDACTSCQSKSHIHQYDDKYNVTGVNMLNASSTTMNLVNAIPLTTTNFKVIAQNQYLSPAVKIHIGDASYQYNVDYGYQPIKNFVTSATLDLTTLPTYNRANIGSLVINMPVDALTAKDWWGNGDVRSGLHPTVTGCVKKSAGTTDGNMYQPVIPPANGVDGPGTNGWNGSTTPATATGARHNGALVIQIIKDTTPNSAIEQNVAGRPEYGWRVKSALYSTYVLAEYTTFWHHPNGLCYGDAGWTKAPGPDTGSSTPVTPAAGSTDPKIGDLSGGGGGTVTNVTRTVSGNVTTTTITYSTGGQATIKRTANNDGTVTIVTTDAGGNVTTETIAASGGSVKTGGDERGKQARTGRISWHELVR